MFIPKIIPPSLQHHQCQIDRLWWSSFSTNGSRYQFGEKSFKNAQLLYITWVLKNQWRRPKKTTGHKLISVALLWTCVRAPTYHFLLNHDNIEFYDKSSKTDKTRATNSCHKEEATLQRCAVSWTGKQISSVNKRLVLLDCRLGVIPVISS